MADAMFISESTINFHVNNMLTKTGYKSLLKLALEATNKGYINANV
jgi:DNA-binding NarL/FixJ family response regulator